MCIRDSPIAIREALEERGIVNGQVADPEKLDNDPFIQQVVSDVEQIAAAEIEHQIFCFTQIFWEAEAMMAPPRLKDLNWS